MLKDCHRVPHIHTFCITSYLVIFTLRFFFINCQKSNAKPECVMIDCFYPLLFFYGQQLGNHTKRLRCLFCSSLQYIHQTVSSQHLLSTLLIQFKLVYGPIGPSNILSTLDFCPKPVRKETNVQLLVLTTTYIMALPVMEFQVQGYKSRQIFA